MMPLDPALGRSAQLMAPIDKSVHAGGGCLCGAVKYEIRGPLRPAIYCHCHQCRRTSGHFVAASSTLKENLVLISDRGLSWYWSSAFARRGFCRLCGSSVLWSSESDNYVWIWAGTLDQPTGIETVEHIYVEYKGDYYDLNDGLPQRPRGRHK